MPRKHRGQGIPAGRSRGGGQAVAADILRPPGPCSWARTSGRSCGRPSAVSALRRPARVVVTLWATHPGPGRGVRGVRDLRRRGLGGGAGPDDPRRGGGGGAAVCPILVIRRIAAGQEALMSGAAPGAAIPGAASGRAAGFPGGRGAFPRPQDTPGGGLSWRLRRVPPPQDTPGGGFPGWDAQRPEERNQAAVAAGPDAATAVPVSRGRPGAATGRRRGRSACSPC